MIYGRGEGLLLIQGSPKLPQRLLFLITWFCLGVILRQNDASPVTLHWAVESWEGHGSGARAEHWPEAGREGTRAALPPPKPPSLPFPILPDTQTASACARRAGAGSGS